MGRAAGGTLECTIRFASPKQKLKKRRVHAQHFGPEFRADAMISHLVLLTSFDSLVVPPKLEFRLGEKLPPVLFILS